MNFSELIENLATRHKMLHHSPAEIHFASNVDSAQNAFGAKMRYPCVIVDNGDFTIIRNGDAYLKHRNITVLFCQHVKDSGNFKEIDKAFADMERLCDDFMTKINRLAHSHLRQYDFLKRMDLDGAQAERVVLESPALFGWGVTIQNAELMCCKDDDVWESVEDMCCR